MRRLELRSRVNVALAITFMLLCGCNESSSSAETRSSQPSGGRGAVSAQIAAITAECAPHTASGRDYLFCTGERSWSAAQADCRAQGMDLARIDSASENTLVAARLSTEAWIGGSDAALEGRWVWSDNAAQFWSGKAAGSAVNGRFSRWAGGQPDDSGNQDCASMRVAGDSRWDDRTCTTQLDYVCERGVDLCPDDPGKMSPGSCGCGVADVDTNGDGAADCANPLSGCAPFNGAGRTYLICTGERSWSQSQSQCRSQGMELARIENGTEDNLLTAHMSGESWIGATDSALEARWVWSNNGPQFWSGGSSGAAVNNSYANWAARQPDDYGTQDCASKRFGSDSRWDDRTCSTELHHVCEQMIDACPHDAARPRRECVAVVWRKPTRMGTGHPIVSTAL
jgi:hypothetical protein